jgi:uncharacterized cupin superfamily protein
VEALDAIDGTPIIDIKPFVKEFSPNSYETKQPTWQTELMKDYFTESDPLLAEKYDVKEAKMKMTDEGLVPEGEGWYVINASEARWQTNEKFGDYCTFEGNEKFDQYGINIHVIHPNQPNCHYHGENDQENFLVISGQCKLLIEGQERLLKPWDFVHCPRWTDHVFIGTGNESCAILMVGGRTGRGVIYPSIDLAKKYNAAPKKSTNSPEESYSGCPKPVPMKAKWPLRSGSKL